MLYPKIFFTLLLGVGFLFIKQNATAQSRSLIEAVRNNDLQEAKTFLENGADINAVDGDSDNVLINAAIYASTDCMQLLLQHKADPNSVNKFGQTPLMYSTNDLAKMKMLVRYGARINDTSKSGNTVLLIACSGYGMHEAVKWLIDNGANVSAKRWGTETALMRAAQFSDTMTISLLLSKGFDINARPWGFTPLMYAVRMGNSAAIPFLIRRGADANVFDDDSTLPVMYAAVAGDLDAVKTLSPLTKNINIKSVRTGMTPLMWATVNEHDDPQIIQVFLDKGADVNFKAPDGSTALSWALKKGSTKTVALLRKAGARE